MVINLFPEVVPKMSVSMPEENYTPGDEAGAGYRYQYAERSSVWEIEEESPGETSETNHGVPLASIREGSLFPPDVQNSEDCVYVAVGKSESSMDALVWALKHAATPSSTVYLIHIFPEIRYIPSPLGRIPKDQVTPAQVESYAEQERGKMRELLQKFLNACSSSKVKADTIVIESDTVASAILELIPILNIRKLVVGTSKSSLRKSKSRKGSGLADQLLQSVLEGCEVKVICEGKEVIEGMIESPSPGGNEDNPMPTQEEDKRNDRFSCMCFKPKFL